MTQPIERELSKADKRLAPEFRFPLARPPAPRSLVRRIASASLVRVTLYYVVVIAAAATLARAFPVVGAAWLRPSIPAISQGTALLTGQAPPASWSTAPGFMGGAVETFLVVIAAILLSIPVAWVYMLTKKLRYDPNLVRSVIILPIAVAGILLVVKNNLAVAFSLAGIVAAVRFRNTLKDPRDAIYIFLTIAIGIAAGVQALDVALIVSMVFNVVVVMLWKYQVGSIYGGNYGKTGVLSIGDSSLLVAQTPAASRTVRLKLLDEASDMQTDGILLVHSTNADLARHTVQDALGQTTRQWKLIGIWPRGDEVKTAEYLIRLAKDTTPADLLGELDEWSTQIEAAEYIPFRTRDQPRAQKKSKRMDSVRKDRDPSSTSKDSDSSKRKDRDSRVRGIWIRVNRRMWIWIKLEPWTPINDLSYRLQDGPAIR